MFSGPLSVRLMMDFRADRALAPPSAAPHPQPSSSTRGGSSSAAIAAPPSTISPGYSPISPIHDATRVLPNPVAEYLDMTDGTPAVHIRTTSSPWVTAYACRRSRRWPAGQSATDAGPLLINPEPQPILKVTTSAIMMNRPARKSPLVRILISDGRIGPSSAHEYVDLPRRDRSREGTTTDDEMWDEVGNPPEIFPLWVAILTTGGA